MSVSYFKELQGSQCGESEPTKEEPSNTDRREVVWARAYFLDPHQSALLLAVRWGVTGWFLTENQQEMTCILKDPSG